MSPTLADTVLIKQHVFEIDGVTFPWHLTEEGPTVRPGRHGMFEVTVTILAERVFFEPDQDPLIP